MIAKATREADCPLGAGERLRGLLGGAVTFLRAPLATVRARRAAAEAAEDAWLAEEAARRLADPEGPPIPWEQVKREALAGARSIAP